MSCPPLVCAWVYEEVVLQSFTNYCFLYFRFHSPERGRDVVPRTQHGYGRHTSSTCATCGNGTTSVANRAAKILMREVHANATGSVNNIIWPTYSVSSDITLRHTVVKHTSGHHTNISNTHVSNSDRSLHLSHHRNAMRRPLAELGEIAYG